MVKLIDVADHLSLSRITVSAVLNDRYKAMGISEATAQRVMATAKEMGYRRNQLAMAIKTGRTFSFGIMVGADRIEDWIGETLKGAFDAVNETDYVIKLDFISQVGTEERSLDGFIGQRVEGLIGINLHPETKEVHPFRQAVEKYGIPMVCNNSAPELAALEIEPNHEQGCQLAMEHLVELGHKRIAYIGGGNVTEAGIRRKEGFLRSLKQCHLGLGPGHLEQCNWKPEQAEEVAEKMLSDKENRPTAILCANDEMAVAAIRRARKMGINVPNDLSVVGFTDSPVAQLSDPPLTVVDMHHDEVGKKALTILLQLTQNKVPQSDLDPQLTEVPATLIVRQSTAAPKS